MFYHKEGESKLHIKEIPRNLGHSRRVEES